MATGRRITSNFTLDV